MLSFVASNQTLGRQYATGATANSYFIVSIFALALYFDCFCTRCSDNLIFPSGINKVKKLETPSVKSISVKTFQEEKVQLSDKILDFISPY